MADSKALTPKDVHLLISFLADPNPNTVTLARRQLKDLLDRRPECQLWLGDVDDPALAALARRLLEEARLETLEREFRDLASRGDPLDLERGAFLLATFAYPQLKAQSISGPLDRLAAELEEILDAKEAAPDEEIKILRRFLFSECEFRGNRENYYDPDNSFLNRVLERRVGIPISLSLVYLLVAQRVDIPAYGIGLPGHFIVGHKVAGRPLFVDPYHGGRWLTRQDCVEIVRHRSLTFRDAFLEPTPNAQILARMIVNLVNVYSEHGAPERAQDLSRLMSLFQES